MLIRDHFALRLILSAILLFAVLLMITLCLLTALIPSRAPAIGREQGIVLKSEEKLALLIEDYSS